MISVILYGRNDSHGYNLYRRAALSLNCIAAVLDDPNDEIIFVDYNTPDDFITFPEAIADTLLPQTREKLRIIRVRTAIHNKLYRDKTDLVALEPMSRNIAIRRSNPKNKWILATNTDMVFVPQKKGQSLSAVVAGLEDGFYELPRFEMPDLLWESLDRMNPSAAMEKMDDWGKRFHINEIVHRWKEMLYDAPGDFQLFSRDAAHAINGFDERHLRGWHLDANLAKRLHLHYGATRTALPHVYGWHCNHTRSASVVHGKGRVNNDFSEVFDEVVRADLPLQRDTWGLPHENLEEIKLPVDGSSSLAAALSTFMPPAASAPYDAPFVAAENVPVPRAHLQVYVADILFSFPRALAAGYIGPKDALYDAFMEVWQKLGFTGKVHVFGASEKLEDTAKRCGIFIAGFPQVLDEQKRELHAEGERVLGVLEQLFITEQNCLSSIHHAPRKFIVLNGGQRPVATLMARYTNAQENPFGTRIRHGFVVKK